MLQFLDRPGFLLVALLGILMFGAKRLPDSARALGRSMRILKAETKGLHDGETTVTQLPAVAPVAAAAPVAPAAPVVASEAAPVAPSPVQS